MKINLEPAYVLHRRPYRDSSLIINLFTLNHGRISVVARSARGLKSRYKGKLEMFSPLLVSWVGRRELKTLGDVELNGMPTTFSGDTLLCGFYLNELLLRLLEHEDPYPNLFRAYQKTLDTFKMKEHLQATLRCFEKKLLHELGYGLSFLKIEPENYYQYFPNRGFERCETVDEQGAVFSGNSLIALRDECFQDSVSLSDAKRLMRMVLSQHLGNKPIKSRELLK